LDCRSVLARDEPANAAGYQVPSVIVGDHRRNAARNKLAPAEESM
jgi:hypothetical protein